MARGTAVVRLLGLGAGVVAAGAVLRARRERRDVPGRHKQWGTVALSAGARLLQRMTPLKQFDTWLVGFHPMKDDPSMQMEAHHYCRQLNEDVMQCVLFDSSDQDARLNGVEYIISERMYESLPEEEKQYWHPHNYEILSGLLVAPGIPAAAEKELMKKKMNSYGKTWHFWHTGGPGKEPQALPLGPPHLAWSFNRDGEADGCLLPSRDKRLGVDTAKKREQRADLAAHAHPQDGVDTLEGAFAGSDGAPPGVKSST